MSVVLFLGCAASDLVPRISRSWQILLRIIIKDYDVLGKRQCCGMPFLLSGNITKAKERAQELAEVINKYDTVITGCPSCYRMFAYFYPKFLNVQLDAKVLHIVHVIYDAIKTGKISFRNSLEAFAYYHDPCELSRHMGVKEEPREILSRIPGLKFSTRISDEKYIACCGGGGLMRVLYPKVSQEIAIEKIYEEILENEHNMIITACPFCVYIISDAIRVLGNEKALPVYDISEVVLMALGEEIEY